jgi:predicted ATPase
VLLETELHAGRSASAVSLVDQFRKTLAEIGERPSDAFEERFGHIGRRSLEVPSTNLPGQTTSFIGREVELGELKVLLAKSRLVTIVGAGGLGKTRVAVHLGAELVHQFDDGVWFADLATTTGEDAVVTEIASAFGVKSSGFSALLEHVVAHLKHKRLLLVLDNCEHVVAEAARVVDAIIEACPRVTILATSRERLGSHGEQVYRLPSLAVPASGEKPEPDDALKFSAVALFIARASASDAHFALTDANVGAVVEICRHLDGIALAIELAAARVTTLNVHQLLERLRKEFRLLKGDDRKVHARYQTMRATLDWSYEWLSAAEKALFRRLGIFRGGWTLESIRAAGVDEALDEFAVLDQLWPLVNKSLVAVEFRAQSQRYRLMEPLRQYALELLKEHAELDATAHHHARFFTQFGRQAGSKWLQVSELTFLANIEEEIDNIRAALDWASGSDVRVSFHSIR